MAKDEAKALFDLLVGAASDELNDALAEFSAKERVIYAAGFATGAKALTESLSEQFELLVPSVWDAIADLVVAA